MIEMSMRYEYCVNRRQVAHAQAGTSQSLQDKNPLCEVGVDHEILSANLKEEAGMTNEGEAELIAPRQLGLARSARARHEGGSTNQCTELTRFSSYVC